MDNSEKYKEIIETNFKGLSDFIDDSDILQFYKDVIHVVIEHCVEDESKELKSKLFKVSSEHDDLTEILEDIIDDYEKNNCLNKQTVNKAKELIKKHNGNS